MPDSTTILMLQLILYVNAGFNYDINVTIDIIR